MYMTDIKRVVEQVSRDKGIAREVLINALEEALKSAARKKYGNKMEIEVHYNEEVGEIEVFQFKDVAEVVTEPALEISLEEGRKLDPECEIGVFVIGRCVVRVETVHLHQNLVERLFAFVVAAAKASATMAAHSVNFIDKDDTGAVSLGLLEQVSHTRSADSDEHLDEIRTADVEERNARLAGDRSRQVGLANARRARHQDPLRDLGAQLHVALGVL